jgi:RecA/RadA recombinase
MVAKKAKKRQKVSSSMKSPAALKAGIESALGPHFAAQLTFRERPPVQLVSSGVEELDALTGGLPRGAITDLY